MKYCFAFFITFLLSTSVFGQTKVQVLTPINRIEKQVQNAFLPWAEKGEFEKTDAYKERISSQAVRVFDSICEHYIFATIKEISTSRDGWEMTYDADDEIFHLKYNYKYREQDEFLDILRKLHVNIKVPIEQAPIFKQQNDRYLVSRPYGDWKMKNGYLIPSKIIIYNRFSNDSITCVDIPLNDTKEIRIPSSIISSNLQPLRGHSYKYTQSSPLNYHLLIDEEDNNVNRNINTFISKGSKSNGQAGSSYGNQGAPSGIGKGHGVGYSLGGRSLRGQLPVPGDDFTKDGDVVVRIKVDRNGNVVDVEAPQKGSKNYDNHMVEAAKRAARKAHFNADASATEYQYGTITFKFRCKQ